jgi:hypothetical protein
MDLLCPANPFLHVYSRKLDNWLPSYGIDLIADNVRATLTSRFSPTFGQNSKQSYGKVKDTKIKLILNRLHSCKVLEIKIFFLI